MPRVPPFLLDALLAGAPEIAVEGETVRLRSHTVVLQEDEERARAAIERTFEAAGLAAPPMAEALAKSGVETRRARTLAGDSGAPETASADQSKSWCFTERHRASAADSAPRKSQYFGVGEFKEWTGISRKYAIPLLEYLDREHITRREGDRRLIL
jgi:selenocysteine-specific elongation factor